MTTEDLDYYVSQFEGSRFFGPISRYRNFERDFDFLQPFKSRKIEQPALFIGGDKDPAFNMFNGADPIDLMNAHVTSLQAHVLAGCGHWTQQEQPDKVNKILIPWLMSLNS